MRRFATATGMNIYQTKHQNSLRVTFRCANSGQCALIRCYESGCVAVGTKQLRCAASAAARTALAPAAAVSQRSRQQQQIAAAASLQRAARTVQGTGRTACTSSSGSSAAAQQLPAACMIPGRVCLRIEDIP
eukprot:SAG25_NODE_351_length_9277_cov_3.879712_3_plen_132_part_00